jgi:PBP1b-binding outer membrane lipoprotein LpoB
MTNLEKQNKFLKPVSDFVAEDKNTYTGRSKNLPMLVEMSLHYMYQSRRLHLKNIFLLTVQLNKLETAFSYFEQNGAIRQR